VGLAGTDRLLDIAIEQADENIKHIRHCQDWITAPVARGDAIAVESDGFVQSPARRPTGTEQG
jgi:hypothetical protein